MLLSCESLGHNIEHVKDCQVIQPILWLRLLCLFITIFIEKAYHLLLPDPFVGIGTREDYVVPKAELSPRPVPEFVTRESGEWVCGVESS